MVQGTTSDAGKSTLVAGLCRLLKRQGWSVAPFKSQNMALNSAVTADGGEIGRAQAVQAQACGIEPTVHMNPVLLKPNTDIGAQVIVHGKALADMDACAYHEYKPKVMGVVMHSFHHLQAHYQAVIIEGAGSPAEINLRDRDIANMGFAEEADCPVIIIADIDKGGVFAHLYGTLALLSESEQNRVIGFVINRFRGDITLLQGGLDWLEQTTGKPVLGVLPYLHGLYLEQEDAIAVQQSDRGKFRIVVPCFPRISNHTDFDPLRLHPQIDLQFVSLTDPMPTCDLLILPGSKNVRADLAALKEQGWESQLLRHLRYGGKVLGICGGYQMLGETLADPLGLEGEAGTSCGLGLLPIHTELKSTKQLTLTSATLLLDDTPLAVSGYEIHLGQSHTSRDGCLTGRPLLVRADGTSDGWLSADKQVAGCYLHGILDSAPALQAIVRWAGAEISEPPDHEQQQRTAIERLADAVEAHLDMARIEQLFTPQWRTP